MVLKIKNRDARRIWLDAQGLSKPPTGDLDIMGIIKSLGFVQLDTIRNISRAHHHILWSRNQNYREDMLNPHLANHRTVFEHFTHDASIIPMEFYPMWARQFQRLGKRTANYARYKAALKNISPHDIKDRIREEGPLSTHDFKTELIKKKGMWNRPPHKIILDQMWYAGELATSHRDKFIKYYDLPKHVIPQHIMNKTLSDVQQIDWLCTQALSRLAFGTLGEIQRFWGAITAVEVRAWANKNPAKFHAVEVERANGDWGKAMACPNIVERLHTCPAPTKRLRILNPFDPAMRDRKRLSELFGFEYRIEIFVPAAQRQYGYYVYPVLEGDKIIARIDAKADRASGQIIARAFWSENGMKWTNARQNKLDAELSRMASFIGMETVVWQSNDPINSRPTRILK
ncbi:MAG: hypothetical protein COA43_13775 [Robiginitomaculum sp.]|nr:MAG: hypothetical protein COA43_13775 [Robiginitomaculum sp.]